MADVFEDRLYAMIAEFNEAPEYIQRLKAKGDAALLFSDLEANPEDMEDALYDLMADLGAPMPSDDRRPHKKGYFPMGYWQLREVTVGELKQAVLARKWPDDAWSYQAYTFRDRFAALVNAGLWLAICVGIATLLLFLKPA